MKIKSRRIIIFAAIFLVIALASALVYFFVFYNKTVAVVDGIKIKQKEVDVYVDFIIKQDTAGEVASDKEQLKSLEASIIDSLVVIKLLEKYAEDTGITVSREEINEWIESVAGEYSSEREFEKDLKDKGINRSFLENEYKGQMLRSKIFEKIAEDVTVTDEEVKQYYEDNKDTLFLVPVSVKASHILAMFPWKRNNSEESKEGREEAREKIELVQRKLNNGEDFEELARQYSDDEGTASDGGDLGYISKGQMVEEFDKVLFSLDTGEVSDIVETEYGFHIIKVYDKKEEYIQDFDEVRGSIETYLTNLYKSAKWEDFVFSLIKEADIQYLTDVEGTLNAAAAEEGSE